MNTLTFRLLLILGLISLCQASIAQSGFIGMKKEFSVDVLNASFGKLNFSYKYSYSKTTSFLIDFGLMNTTKENLNEKKYIDSYSPLTKYKGINAGIGFLWNSKFTGMNMPIGYYTGISLDFFIGKLTNIIPANFLNETMEWNGNGQYGYGSYSTYNKTNPNKIEFPFMVTGYNFNLFLGKNTYLGKNITLDIFTKLGLGYFSFKPTNFTAYPSAPFGSSITEPNRVGGNASGAYSVYDKVEGVYYIKRGGFNLFPDFYSYPIHKALKPNGYSPSGENIWGYYIYSGSNKPYTYHRIKLIVYPQIKIGYLF